MPMQANQMSVRELLEMVFANKWLFLLCTVVGLIIAYYMAETQDKVYQSFATIHVTDRLAGDPIIGNMGVINSVQSRFEEVRVKVMSQDNMERMAKELELSTYSPEYPMETVKEIIDSIKVGYYGASISVSCSRSGEDAPEETAKIANYVANEMVESSQNARVDQLNHAKKILGDVEGEYAAKLANAELALYQYEQYLDPAIVVATPQEAVSDLNRIEGAQKPNYLISEFGNLVKERAKNEMELAQMQNTLVGILQQLEEEPEFTTSTLTMAPVSLFNEIEKRLGNALVELGDMQEGKTENHPFVIKKRAEIEKLRLQLGKVSKPTVKNVERKANPLRESLLQQASDVRLQIESLDGQVELSGDKILALQTQISQIPAQQRMLDKLKRTYDMHNIIFEDLLERTVKTELTVVLEDAEKSMRFELLNRAVPPNRPVSPNRNFILAMGTFVGAVVGLVLCFFREFTDTSFRNLDDASRYLDLPVLGVIPEVVGTPRRRRIRKQRRAA